jgi:hypothetical protein
MTAHQTYAKAMAATLQDWSRRIADLRARARKADGEQQLLVSRHMAILHDQRQDYEAQMNETRMPDPAPLAEIQVKAEGLVAEFERIIAQAASRFTS